MQCKQRSLLRYIECIETVVSLLFLILFPAVQTYRCLWYARWNHLHFSSRCTWKCIFTNSALFLYFQEVCVFVCVVICEFRWYSESLQSSVSTAPLQTIKHNYHKIHYTIAPCHITSSTKVNKQTEIYLYNTHHTQRPGFVKFRWQLKTANVKSVSRTEIVSSSSLMW